MAWSLLVDPVFRILDKILPDEAAREAAKLELLKQQQAGNIQEVEAQLSAIIAEAQSSDPYTSRARPSFLYVIYVFILAALPMGLVYAANPDTANAITEGVKAWLVAIPEELYTLFGVGYLGYTGARSLDKRRISANQLPWQQR